MTNLLKNHINTGLIIMTKIIKIRLEVPSPNPSKSIVFERVGPGFEFFRPFEFPEVLNFHLPVF